MKVGMANLTTAVKIEYSSIKLCRVRRSPGQGSPGQPSGDSNVWSVVQRGYETGSLVPDGRGFYGERRVRRRGCSSHIHVIDRACTADAVFKQRAR